MSKVTRIIARTLSFRLSLRIIAALALLLMLALMTMFYFSRKAVREEALQNAGQTLETMEENIDNVLLSVEQAAGNIYWKMMGQANQPELMETYAHKLVECNPYITDSRIICGHDDENGNSDLARFVIGYQHSTSDKYLPMKLLILVKLI